MNMKGGNTIFCTSRLPKNYSKNSTLSLFFIEGGNNMLGREWPQ